MNYKLSKHPTILPTYHHSRGGFSILMAIGTIGVLLVLVTSLAMSYIRESKLSRFSYNEVLASTASEGIFEYGMLKVRNHKEGFQDSVSPIEPDGSLLRLSTPRSRGLEAEYNISSSSTGHIFSLSGGEHLVIPLFVSDEGLMPIAIASRKAEYNTGVINTSDLSISGIGNLSWTIVAMSGSESMAITGTGNIGPLTSGSIRIKTSQCYSQSDGSLKSCSASILGDEEIIYTYDETKTISNFLQTKVDPYFILYNPNNLSIPPLSIDITASSAFTLPTLSLTASAKKGDSSQVFRFTEDKGKYYDALKYGIYNTSP